MNTATLVTFVLYLLGMIGIGVWAYFQTRNLSDYILGGRRLGSLVTALSASATDMSGWLLLGLPGAIYAAGLSEVWIALGLAVGAYFNWRITAPRLRVYTEAAGNAITLSDYLTNRFEDNSNLLRVISALVILVFFTVYVASGLTAGAKLFEASFGMGYEVALIVGAVVIVSYTFVGGFLAVSWTDVVQGLLMVTALVVAPIVMWMEMGSVESINQTIAQVDAKKMDWFAGKSAADYLLSISFFSLMAWGLGYFGQPHLLARFMAAKSVADVHKARRIAMSWMLISMVGALAVGYFAIGYFVGKDAFELLSTDSEKVFIVASQVLFHPLVAGFLLAAILAAVMSTIDSQLLVSSSAVTEDFYRVFYRRHASDKELVWVGRCSVLVIALIAVMIATDKDSKVLGLVSNAWAGFGAAFGPVIVMSLVWKGMTRNGALAGMLGGALTVIFWIAFKEELGGVFKQTYEMIPGVIVASLAAYFASKTQTPSQNMVTTFEQVDRVVKQS
ncbi:sodium/proline symporter PutP [Pleionea sp. CnH1-48]|uniref:sodium/proline symporter PutP n=1 Tax=Pleionea sp. CnH1-48 TaxID=2954494 RepID=UPI00209853FD|nr:sodium/proline symporter PutP [Pleionea sp. CnH1-48]MCO7226392.1 sodium/proline symporter PutP [Pleionea sp. CnH1-48]